MNAPTIDLSLTEEPTLTTTILEDTPTEEAASPNPFNNMLLPMAACFLVFWFIVIRPEKRQRKAREAMLSALKKGDDVVTSGGIHGKVAQVKEDVVTVQVADNVRMRFSLAAVQNKVSDDEPVVDEDEDAKEE